MHNEEQAKYVMQCNETHLRCCVHVQCNPKAQALQNLFVAQRNKLVYKLVYCV